MLEDSRDCSSPELDSPCNQTDARNRWHYEEDYENASYHDEYPYESETVAGQINGHAGNPQQGYPLAPTWDQPEQEYQQARRMIYMSEKLNRKPGAYSKEIVPSGDHYKASYNPYQLDSQAKMFNTEVPLQHQDGNFDQLQREFLDSAQKTADSQQLAQIQILNKAQLRQIEDLERKLEDSRRSVRYLEHQFAIVKDEKEGLGVSLKESGRLLEDAQEREVQLQASIKTLELQVQALNDRDHENVKNQRAAEAAVDSLQQQMAELCRSESLARVREQHDRDLTVVREQHDAKLLVLQQRLDAADRALDEQAVVVERLQAQLKQQERQREEEQVEKAGVVNSLTQCLEDSQRRCAGLLQTGSVQEMGQLQVKLQQSLSAKTMTDNMNRALQEELSDLKEQICLYESAVKHGVISLERKTDNCSWEKQLSDSYVDLGIKRSNWKNGRLHSPQRSGEKDDWAVRELRAELQRCLASLKGKRQRIDLLQEELREAQGQVGQLQTQLDQAKTITTAETPLGNPASQNELSKLEEDRQRLQEHVEILENRNAELKQSEEKVKAANLELCTKMREMIQELDQEKQEAAERHERTQQQFRDDVVNRVRSDLAREHTAQVEHLTAENQQHLQLLQAKVTEVNEEMLAVQECYISVCKEKDRLEENLRATKVEEEKRRENEVTSTNNSNNSSYRLGEQRLQLKQEADVAQCRAVEDAGKRVQRELQEKHLEDMARQVEGAVTRAYCRWLEDLTSLPQYKAALQRERERWEKEQEPHLQQRVSLALRAAEEQWLEERHRSREGEKEAEGDHRVEELQEEVLRWRQLEEDLKEERVQKATLLKAELAAARASWNRDKQQEISTLQAFQQEQLRRAQEKAQEAKEEVQKLAREEAERMSKELLQKEAELKQALRSREEEWRCLEESRGQEQRKRGREEAWSEVLQEFHVGLKEVQAVLLNGGPYKEKNKVGEVDGRRPNINSEFYAHVVFLLKVSEERLGRLLKDTQERHKKEIECIKSIDGGVCGEQCAETRAKLQKKSQDLQKHLEKACRQLQAAVKEHKASMRRLKDHEIALRREKEDSLQKLEEVKRSAAKGHSGVSDVDQSLHAGLEEMKGQYLKAVEKIRGDMLRYLQESKERAAEMIRVEVLRERQDTARKMRRYYLACLQELLEDGGQATGAEKKIINAASKLAAMAKVLETPTKRETGKSYSLPLATGLSLKTHASTASSRTRQSGSASNTAGQPHLPPPGHFLSLPHRPSHQIGQNSTLASYHGDFTNVTLRNQSSRELYLEGVESGRSDDDNFLCHRSNSKPFLIQEEHPVRDERRSNDWSLSNDGCQDGPRVLAGSSYPGRKMDTVNNDLTQSVPGMTTLSGRSAHRYPVPGSEGGRQDPFQNRLGSKSQFSELKLSQQPDSGFESPFSQQK
uniref:CEP152 CEP63 binding coiled coil domain-containing protein n=1 Tax=Esox lucius TaxID=8010 RepID=A0A3P8XHP4_ESOLU